MMGYEVHITRKDNWFDEDGKVITRDEYTKFGKENLDMWIFDLSVKGI